MKSSFVWEIYVAYFLALDSLVFSHSLPNGSTVVGTQYHHHKFHYFFVLSEIILFPICLLFSSSLPPLFPYSYDFFFLSLFFFSLTCRYYWHIIYILLFPFLFYSKLTTIKKNWGEKKSWRKTVKCNFASSVGKADGELCGIHATLSYFFFTHTIGISYVPKMIHKF